MNDTLRHSGIAVIPEIPWGTHICLFYQSAQDLLDVLLPYFKAGVENHEACLWVVPAPLTCEQAEAALRGVLPPGGDFEQQIVILPYEDWHPAGLESDASFKIDAMLGRWLEHLDQALKSGFEGIRVAGNADWVIHRDSGAGVHGHFNYDRSVNEAINEYRMIALCEYSLNDCQPQEIIEVVQCHQISLVRSDDRWNAMISSDYQKAQSALAERFEREQRELAEALRKTAAQLNSTLDLDELLDRIVIEAQHITPHDIASIVLCDGETVTCVRKSCWEIESGEITAQRVNEHLELLPTTQWIYTNRQPLLIPDVDKYPNWKYRPGTAWVRSYLGLPLRRNGNIFGILNLKSARPGFFSAMHVDQLQAFTEQAATAIENARLLLDVRGRAEQLDRLATENACLFQEAQRRADELGALARISNTLRSAPNRAAMLPIILDQVIETLSAEGASFATLDPITKETVIEMGRNGSAHLTGLRMATGSSITAHVLESGQVFVTENLLSDPRFNAARFTQSPSAVTCLPLYANGEIVGALWVGRQTPFTDVDLRLLQAIADIAANAIHRSTLHERTELHLQRLYALHAVDKAINSSLDLDVVLNVLLDQVTLRLQVDAADMLLLNPRTQTLEYRAGRGFKTSAITQSRLYPGEGAGGRAVLERRIVHISDLSQAGQNLKVAKLLTEEGFVAHFAVPLIAKGQVKGVLDIFHRALLQPDQDWIDFLQALADQAAIAVDNASLFSGLQQSNIQLEMAYDATLQGWVRTLELRDHETEEHAQRVTDLTLRLAEAAGLPEEDLIHIRRGALLHDIGKMGIPDNILLKSGPLTDAERGVMQQHTVYAYELLKPISYLAPALDIPYCHHERWDGSGYPRGLKGERIPVSARLFAVADVWDALLSDRPYRPAWDGEQARAYILEQAGKQFDPQVVELFFQVQFAGKKPAPISILAVDDDIHMTYLVSQALQDRYRVYTANSSEMALEILRENEIELVITDMKMPGLSGVELLDQAQGIRPGMLGIIVSGYTDPDALAAALNLGCVRGFLSKPWNFDQLLTRVEQVLTSSNGSESVETQAPAHRKLPQPSRASPGALSG